MQASPQSRKNGEDMRRMIAAFVFVSLPVAAGLSFAPTNGSFVVHVRQKATGAETSTLVQIGKKLRAGTNCGSSMR